MLATLMSAVGAQESSLKGKTLRIVVGSGAGGSSGTIAQVLAEHIGRKIPGNPAVIPQYMPGAGGAVAMNYVVSAAPTDGTVLGLYLPGALIAELLTPAEARYKSRDIQWVGRVLGYTSVLSVMSDAPATTIAQARSTEITVAATGRSSPAFQEPVLAASALNMKLKFIFGYSGSAEMTAAMERGEVNGRIMASNAWEAQRPDWLRNGRLAHLVQIGPGDPVRMQNVPLLRDLVKTDRERALATFAEIGPRSGWGVYLAPKVPQPQVTAIRDAFNQVMADERFRSDVQRAVKADVEPLSWEELTDYVKEVMSIPAEMRQEIVHIVGVAH
jgi:tripartite-type tricarboxylate transporter receptor subunit TctC